MAFRGELNGEIELHRKNAALETELASERAQNQSLRSLIIVLVEELASKKWSLPSSQAFTDDGKSAQALNQYKDAVTKPGMRPGTTAEPLENDRELKPFADCDDDASTPRFLPFSDDPGHYRGVLVEKIPTYTTLEVLTSRISCGLIFSIKLLNTQSLLGSNTAMITFVNGLDAARFIDHSLRHPVTVYGETVKITQIPTPCHPIPERTLHQILDEHATRCLVISDFPRHLHIDQLRRIQSSREHVGMDGIIGIFEDKEGLVHVILDSVETARSMRVHIHGCSTFRPARAEFAPDPCSIRRNVAPGQNRFSKTPTSRSREAPWEARTSSKRFYRDLDAPVKRSSETDLDYGETVPQPCHQESARSSKLIDYSDLWITQTNSSQQQEQRIKVGEQDIQLKLDDTKISRRSSLESGEVDSPQQSSNSIATDLRKTAFGSSALNDLDQDPIQNGNSALQEVGGRHSNKARRGEYPGIVNRHLGPPQRSEININSSAIVYDSDSDSVESERAKARRCADEMLAEMQKHDGMAPLSY